MRLLKAVLYLVLSLCVLWGVIVTLGPTIIGVALSKSFGEQQLRLTGLTISPKLQISASRAEFDFRDNRQLLYGAVRAPKFKILPTIHGWSVQVSSGLLIVNDTISLPSFKADFYTDSLTNFNAGQFSFSAPALAVKEDFEFSVINISSSVNLSLSELRNLTFSAKTASVIDTRNGDNALLDTIVGRLAQFSIHQEWQRQLLDFDLSSKTTEIQSHQFGKIDIQSFLLQAQNDGPTVDCILMADSLSMDNMGLYLKGIKANPIIDSIALAFQKETLVQIEQGRFERSDPNIMSGNIKGLEVVVGLHLPERFLELTSDISDLEIWNKQVPLITMPDLALDIKAMISPIAKMQHASAQFEAVINGEDGSVVTGELDTQLFNLVGLDCLTETCVASDVLLDFKYEYEGEQMIGKGSCPSGQCGDETFALTVETSNTAKIVVGLTKQKIVNPLALVIFAGSIMQGQEVGPGHKIKF